MLLYKKLLLMTFSTTLVYSGVEAGSNTSTVPLRVVGGDENRTQCLGCNLATLFLGDINSGDRALQVKGVSKI
jgi:hypothetical protein